MDVQTMLKSYSGILWNAADHILKLGLSRLIALPLMAAVLEAESFGALVTAMAICFIMGGGITTAYTNYIVKNLGHLSKEELERHSMGLSIRVVPLCVVLFVVLALLLRLPAFEFTRGEFWFWYWIFVIHYSFTAQSEVLISQYRVQRNFQQLTSIHLFAVFLSILILLPSWSFVSAKFIVAMSLLIWGIAPSIHALYLQKGQLKTLLASTQLDIENKQVLHFFVAGVVMLSTGYLDRIMLAFWWPSDSVAIFFAAVSLAMMMSAPALIFSTYMLSMLSKVPSESLQSRRVVFGYFGVVAGVCLFIYLGGSLVSDLLLKLLYADYYSDAVGILNTCIASAAIMSFSTMLRPVAIRYRRASYVSSASLVTLLFRILITLYFIRLGGFHGAADALLYGSIFTSLVWGVLYFFQLIPSKLVSGNSTDGTTV